jgi:MFS family permease
MVADLVEPERRAGAYALLRMGNNLWIAIGPAVGGFVTSVSYRWAFYAGSVAYALFSLLVLLFLSETLALAEEETTDRPKSGGYGPLLHDGPFLGFSAISTLVIVPASLMMVLLPVYAKEQFGVPESQYGFIMTTNAAMVVLFQYAITQATRRHRPAKMLALGAVFYALGTGSVALGRGFPAFLLSMVVMTVGELIIVPTGTSLAASLSPPDMRGRYMGVYGLTWGIGLGIGPVLGGMLSDQIAPMAIWIGGLVVGLGAAAGFVLLGRRLRDRELASHGPSSGHS